MPTALYTAKDGTKARIKFDSDAQLQEAIATLEGSAAPAPALTPPRAGERFQRGLLDVGQGIKQILSQAADADSPYTRRAKQLQYNIGVKPGSGESAADYTARVNAEREDYARRRGPDAGIDWLRIGGNITATLPAAVITGGSSLPALAATGAVQGGLSSGLQFDPTNTAGQRLKNTATGAAIGAVISPIAGVVSNKIGQGLKVLYGRLKGAASKLSADDILREIPELADVPESVRGSILREAEEQFAATGNISAEQLARKANLIAQGAQPTRAMVTRSAADWTTERNLQKLVGSQDERLAALGQRLTDIYTGNDKALAARLASFSERLPKATQEAHGKTVMSALDDLAEASQKDISELYAAVRAAKGGEAASDAVNLKGVLDDLSDNAYAEKLVTSVTSRLKKFGMVDQEGKLTKSVLTVKQAEELRKFVNSLPSDPGKREIIKAIDTDVLAGAGEDAFKGARGAAAERFRLLANPATQKALDALGELAEGRTAQNFIRSQVVSAPTQDVKALVATLSKVPDVATRKEALGALRAGVLQHLESKAINPNSGQFSGAQLARAMREIGDGKLEAVLGSAELKKLQNLARAGIDATFQPPYAAVNASNTAPALAKFAEGVGATPLFGPFLSPDALGRILARQGYGTQLSGALAAQPTRALPELPPELARALTAFPGILTPAVVSPLNQRKQAANE